MENRNTCSVCDRVMPEDNEQLLKAAMASQFLCPFVCPECKYISCGVRATSDRSFVWPIPKDKTFLANGVIERPPSSNDAEDELSGRSPYGIVLSMGPGYWSNTSKCCKAHVVQKKVPTCTHCNSDCFYEYEFHPVQGIERGTVVVYDMHVPWKQYFRTFSGGSELVVMCGAADINGIVTDYYGKPE
jgi:hypothetical protein